MRVLDVLFRKAMKRLGAVAPTNILRVLAFRMAGYQVGKDVWIGPGLLIVDDNLGNDRLFIGDRAAIAPRVTIILQSYPNRSRLRNIIPMCSGDVVIGSDAWIGAGSIILPNIRIGHTSIVGAGSIVTKSVDERLVVVGNPAKFLRSLNEEPGLGIDIDVNRGLLGQRKNLMAFDSDRKMGIEK